MASQLEDIYAKKRPKEKGFKITSSKKKRNKKMMKQPKNAFMDEEYIRESYGEPVASPKFTVDAMLDDLNFDNRPPS